MNNASWVDTRYTIEVYLDTDDRLVAATLSSYDAPGSSFLEQVTLMISWRAGRPAAAGAHEEFAWLVAVASCLYSFLFLALRSVHGSCSHDLP